MSSQPGIQIATATPEQGLDFAAPLLCGGIQTHARESAERAANLAIGLAQYFQYRYAEEFGLAWEELVSLGDACATGGLRNDQFWLQLHFTGLQLDLPELDFVSRTTD